MMSAAEDASVENPLEAGSGEPAGARATALDLEAALQAGTLTEAQAIVQMERKMEATVGNMLAKMQAEIDEIDHGVRIFQLSKCSASNHPLDLPAVHFLCQHSFNAASLGDNDNECLVCAPQRRRIAEHAQQQRALAHGQDDFFKHEQTSADAFGALAELIGRGMLIDVAGEPRGLS